MSKSKRILSLGLILTFLTIFASVAISLPVQAQTTERDFSISTPYTHVVMGKGKDVELDVKITNLGKINEEILLSVSGPEEWEPRLVKKYDGYEVQAIWLLHEEGSNSVDLALEAEPPGEVATGDYVFTLQGTTRDGEVNKSLEVTITLKAKAPVKEVESVKLTPETPGLEQPAGKEFEYEIELKNNLDEERVFDLAAKVPSRWQAYATPRYEKEKRMTSIKVNANTFETLRFVLTPPFDVAEGDYTITLEARSGDDVGSIELKATVTGTYKLMMGTEAEVIGSGETRNVKATAGRGKTFTIYLWNEGSAAISDIDFFSSKPKDWEVKFEPEKIRSLDPLTREMKPEKLQVTIEPKAKAIPGDYTVSVTASGREAQEEMELRVTVVTPMTWGWVGIGIVVVVVAALIGIFVRLGRR